MLLIRFGDNDRDSGSNSDGDNDGINKCFNKGYGAKMTRIQDESGMLVNHGTTTSYISNLKPGDQLVSTSLYVKKLAFGLKLNAATCIKFT